MRTLSTFSIVSIASLFSINSYAVCYDSTGTGTEITDMDTQVSNGEFVRCFVVPERQYEEFSDITLIRSDGLQHTYFSGTAALNPIDATSGETLATGITNNPPLGDYEWAIVTTSRYTDTKASVPFPVSGSSASCSTTGTYTASSASTLESTSWNRHDPTDDPVATSPSSGFPYFYSRPTSGQNNIYQRAWVDRYPRPDESNGAVSIAKADNFARSSRGWSKTTTANYGLTDELYRSDRPNFYKSVSATNSNQMKYRVGIGTSQQITNTLSVDPNELVAFDVTVSIPDTAQNGVEFLFQRYNNANYCLGWRRSKQDISFNFYTVEASEDY